MAISIEATYENGVLKPAKPLALQENERVSITIRPSKSLARQTAGVVPWAGTEEELDRLICDPDFGN